MDLTNRCARNKSVSLMNRCKEMLVARGCGMCARRIRLGDNLVFVFRATEKLPHDVVCEVCMNENAYTP